MNPSDREFCDKSGNILLSEKERLCSRTKLNRLDNEELNDSEAEIVLKYCDNYFHKNPYKSWFNKYEKFLNCFELSYYDNSVVHLDLVQWSTTPFWGKLSKEVQEELLRKDLPFLKAQLRKSFEYIFLNGLTTVSEVSSHLNIDLQELDILLIGKRQSKIFFGQYNGARVIGWSPYLQSPAVGGYANIQKVAQIIKNENEKNLTSRCT